MFLKNGYPKNLFFSSVRKFMDGIYNSRKPKITEDRVETLFFIPYFGLPSLVFGRKLKGLLNTYYNTDMKVIYTSFKVKNYFSVKPRTPLPLLANVVYKFKSLCDANNTYIGKTLRHLATRVKEHSTRPSAVKDHLSSCIPCQLFMYKQFFNISFWQKWLWNYSQRGPSHQKL